VSGVSLTPCLESGDVSAETHQTLLLLGLFMNGSNSLLERDSASLSRAEWQIPADTHHILLVEDNIEMRNMLCEMVRHWGCCVSAASSLRAARRTIEANGASFAVALCDYHLPDGNGLELFAWLRLERRMDLPFVLMSAHADFSGVGVGDFQFLGKPFSPTELRVALQHFAVLP
jgi:CheY-like chemotaxis protein